MDEQDTIELLPWYLYASTWDRYMRSRLMPRPDDSGTRSGPRICRVSNWNISLFVIVLSGCRRVTEPYRNKKRAENPPGCKLKYFTVCICFFRLYRTQTWAESGTATSILLLDWIWRVRDGLCGLDWGGYGINPVGWAEADTGQFYSGKVGFVLSGIETAAEMLPCLHQC